MVNFGPLAAEIGPVVRGTPAYFKRFRVLAALLHRYSHFLVLTDINISEAIYIYDRIKFS